MCLSLCNVGGFLMPAAPNCCVGTSRERLSVWLRACARGLGLCARGRVCRRRACLGERKCPSAVLSAFVRACACEPVWVILLSLCVCVREPDSVCVWLRLCVYGYLYVYGFFQLKYNYAILTVLSLAFLIQYFLEIFPMSTHID